MINRLVIQLLFEENPPGSFAAPGRLAELKAEVPKLGESMSSGQNDLCGQVIFWGGFF